MRVCLKCGYRDNDFWQHSRFDFNADYMRFDEAQNIPELKMVVRFLLNSPNFMPFLDDPYTYYRRGTGGLYLYRVLSEDFKVPRERKKHRLEGEIEK